MKYTTKIKVNLPRETLIKKLDNPDNMKHWQRGLTQYKEISGSPGEEGAQMELHYDMGKRKMVLVETILKRNFPEEFHATYDAKGVHNIQKNFFHEIDANTTEWESQAEFQFDSFFMKMMGFLMPGAFKKQSMKYARDFKAFAEDGVSVAPQIETHWEEEE
ncbi:MAG: SRPBCC family protein [Flavobacteriaceae bacterium]|nr:SRPBCC family protein [Flavobacteriaceae bacterium]